MADWNFGDIDGQSQWDKNQQDWGIDPSKYRDFRREEQQRRDMEREARRMREELERQNEERARQIERFRQLERQRREVDGGEIFHRGLLDSLKTHSEKSGKELMIERIAIKFCFVRNRLSVWKTLAAVGIIKNPFENRDESALLKKIFESVISEGARNGITRKEISEAIMKMSAEVSEGEMAEMFVNHYLGKIALNVFRTNPNIIKDVKSKSSGPKTRPRTLEDYFPRDRDITTEEILRMIREVNDLPRNDDLYIMDYPNLFTRYQAPAEAPTINAWLEHLRRWRD